MGWAPIAYACNPSFSGGRDGRITVRSQPRQIVLETLSWKNGGLTWGVGPVQQKINKIKWIYSDVYLLWTITKNENKLKVKTWIQISLQNILDKKKVIDGMPA
jgi:hypothetical protein